MFDRVTSKLGVLVMAAGCSSRPLNIREYGYRDWGGGSVMAWDSAGTLTSEGVFIDGCKDGVWEVLDDQSGTYSLEIWDYGMLTKQIPMCE